MLRRFDVHHPASVSEACALRREHAADAAVYAGGTELLLAMKLGVAHWPHLIDVKHIPELQGLRLQDETLVIGAAVTHYRLETDETVRRHLPSLARLESQVGNVRVRVAGTLAGNLAFAEPHADPPALLVALGTKVRLKSIDSERIVSLEDFLTGPYETALGSDEILTAIEVPLPPTQARCAYLNFRVLERPSIGVAVVARLSNGRIEGIPSLVLGAINDVPTRVDAVGLAGLVPESTQAQALVAEAARQAADARADLAGSAEYKTHLVGIIAARVLASLSSGGVSA